MAEHNELGKRGEQLAAEFLLKKGYKILTRNYSFKKSELDIVSENDGKLVIVEVKTRNSDYLAGPEVTVTKKKQRGIIRAANFYIEENDWRGETQFDIVSIILNQNEERIEHIEDAFYPLI